MDKISIILTVYNKANYLRDCLDSLKNQTYKNYEVIIVDDGSTDNCVDICLEYVKNNARFRYFYQENSGQNAARKLGVKKALGEWILSVDADDFVSIDICEKLMEAKEKTGADIVFGRVQKFQDGEYRQVLKCIEGIYSGINALKQYIDKQFFSFGMPSGMYPILYPKKFLDDFFKIVDLRINFSEDCACTLYSLANAGKVCFISDVVYYYRQISESFCHVHKKTNVFSQKLLKNFLEEVLPFSGNEVECERVVRWLIVRDLLLGGYEYFADYSGIYPYCEMPTGNRIAIYGAGVLGEEIYEKLSSKYICAGWFDREAEYYQKNGKEVSSPEEINEELFDYILIAVTNPDTSKQIATELKRKMKNPDKVLTILEQIIDSSYTLIKLKDLEGIDESYCYVPTAISSC